jgi:hypothetical protein
LTVPSFFEIESALEYYLPAVLREVDRSWQSESLDGFFTEIAILTAPRQAQLAGYCILISDQTLTPFHIQLRVASDTDEIEWLDCKLGEIRNGTMVRIPYNAPWRQRPPIADRLQTIDWQFHVGFGNPC